MRKHATKPAIWTTNTIQFLTQDELRRLLNVVDSKRAATSCISSTESVPYMSIVVLYDS